MSELLTVKDVAAVMKIGEDAVSRIFAKVDGVIDLGRAETRDKRRYRVLRIPKAVVEKYLSTKAGHPVCVEVPDRPERRRRSENWEDKAILNLAKAGLQNECVASAAPPGVLASVRLPFTFFEVKTRNGDVTRCLKEPPILQELAPLTPH